MVHDEIVKKSSPEIRLLLNVEVPAPWSFTVVARDPEEVRTLSDEATRTLTMRLPTQTKEIKEDHPMGRSIAERAPVAS